jgi:hypothetical protein
MQKIRMKPALLLTGALLCSGLSAYIVKKGDTLWDLSGTFLENPFRWPEIWERNPQVANPHWIYPGDSLRIEGLDRPVLQSNTRSDSLPKSVQLSENQDRNRANQEFISRLGSRIPQDTTTQNLDNQFIQYEHGIPNLLNPLLVHTAPRLVPLAKNTRVSFADQLDWRQEHNQHHQILSVGHEFEITLRPGQQLSAPMTVYFYNVVPKSSFNWKNQKYQAVQYVGEGVIQLVAHGEARGTVTQARAPIRLNDIMKLEPLVDPIREIYTYVPEEQSGPLSEVVGFLRSGLRVLEGDYVFIGGPAISSYEPGDALALWEPSSNVNRLPRLVAQGTVFWRQGDLATVYVGKLEHPRRSPRKGDWASLSFRAR